MPLGVVVVTYLQPIPKHQQVDQPVPKISRGKSIKPDSITTGRSGNRSILGCTAMIKAGNVSQAMSEVGKFTFTARGAWTVRGVHDWNHATEQLRDHSDSKWRRDAVIYS